MQWKRKRNEILIAWLKSYYLLGQVNSLLSISNCALEKFSWYFRIDYTNKNVFSSNVLDICVMHEFWPEWLDLYIPLGIINIKYKQMFIDIKKYLNQLIKILVKEMLGAPLYLSLQNEIFLLLI